LRPVDIKYIRSLPVRLCLLLFLVAASATRFGDDSPWTLMERGRVGTLETSYTAVAYYVPKNPIRVLVLAHGFPWRDGTQSDEALAAYAREDASRWAAFAEQNHTLLLVPAFGGRSFPDYREMAGRTIGPDEFLNRLIDGPVAGIIPHFDGRLNLHGHSAGAQFAARYLVAHPERLDQVILSAPSTYPMPDTAVAWPFGMAQGASAHRPEGWLRAATEVSVTVLVGSRDTEQRPPAPGQRGSSRLDRAKSWVAAMGKLARSHGRESTIRFVEAPGLGHDEAAMAIPAQSIFTAQWQ
jgi:pimeloyl-ACP methyl ester carboxylesterase